MTARMRLSAEIVSDGRLRIALWIGAGLISAALVWKGFSYSASRLSDFAGYYVSSAMVAAQDTLPFLYDDARFQKRVRERGIVEPTIIFYVNPPPASLFALAVTRLEPLRAKFAWNGFLLGCLGLAFLLARSFLGIPRRSLAAPILFGMLFCTVPFLQNLERGQVYPLLLLLVLLLWHGYSRGKPWLVAVPLAMLILLKYFGWMFLILMLAEKRWRETLATGAALVAGGAGSYLFFGSETYARHADRLVSAVASMDFSLTGLPCVPAFFGALLAPHPRWNPDPIADIPWLATLLTATALLTALALTIVLTRDVRPQRSAYRFFSLLVLSVAFTPLAADHHYLLLSLPVVFLLQSMLGKYQSGWLLGLLAAIFLVAGYLPHWSISECHGWLKLICFPRLYGAVAVWMMMILHYRVPPALRNA